MLFGNIDLHTIFDYPFFAGHMQHVTVQKAVQRTRRTEELPLRREGLSLQWLYRTCILA